LYQLLEERQLIWDQREVQLERQLDSYEKQQNEILSTAQKVAELTNICFLMVISCLIIYNLTYTQLVLFEFSLRKPQALCRIQISL